jgi:hypothetical protein
MNQIIFPYAIGIISLAAAIFWFWSSRVQFPWTDANPNVNRAFEFAINHHNIREWPKHFAKASTLDAIAALLSAIAALLFAFQLFWWNPDTPSPTQKASSLTFNLHAVD